MTADSGHGTADYDNQRDDEVKTAHDLAQILLHELTAFKTEALRATWAEKKRG